MMTSLGWNVPFYQNRKVSKIRSFIEPRMVDLIHEHNDCDIELYDFAKKLFEENLRRNAGVIGARFATLNSGREPGYFRRFWHSTEGAGRFLLSNAVSAVMTLKAHRRMARLPRFATAIT